MIIKCRKLSQTSCDTSPPISPATARAGSKCRNCRNCRNRSRKVVSRPFFFLIFLRQSPSGPSVEIPETLRQLRQLRQLMLQTAFINEHKPELIAQIPERRALTADETHRITAWLRTAALPKG